MQFSSDTCRGRKHYGDNHALKGGLPAITALIDKELKMYQAQLPHFASKAILVKALTRCLKKTEAVRG